MTLTLPYEPIEYISNGVIDTYSIASFDIQNVNQIVVDIYDTDGVLVNPSLYPYTANISSIDSEIPAKSILFDPTVPPENYIIIISRLTEQTQEVSFSTLGGYNSKTLENILSKIVQMIQETSDTVNHGTPLLNQLQRDWVIERLLNNNTLLYVDTVNKTIRTTNFPKENVVQATGGMYFRQITDGYGNNILQFSLNGIDWISVLNGGAADVHNNLLHRDAADAHPASAITGVQEHIDNINNPHQVTKDQVGLGNVDNTSDANKPISTATQTALDAKANLSGATFTGDISATNLSGTNTGDQDLSSYAIDDEVVHLTGEETITGVKNFLSSPTVPTPTTGTQAVNKDYVDNSVSATPTKIVTCSTALYDLTLTGTVSVTNGSTAVTGSGTSFTTQLAAGDTLVVNGCPARIASVTNNTALVLSLGFSGATASGQTGYKANNAKTVDLTGITVAAGTQIIVNFTNGNYGQLPTLNSGAIYNDSLVAVSYANPAYFPANVNIPFYRDATNTYWIYRNLEVKTYKSGATKYSVRADGWCRQSDKVITTITSLNFPIIMQGIDYDYFIQHRGDSALSYNFTYNALPITTGFSNLYRYVANATANTAYSNWDGGTAGNAVGWIVEGYAQI